MVNVYLIDDVRVLYDSLMCGVKIKGDVRRFTRNVYSFGSESPVYLTNSSVSIVYYMKPV